MGIDYPKLRVDEEENKKLYYNPKQIYYTINCIICYVIPTDIQESHIYIPRISLGFPEFEDLLGALTGDSIVSYQRIS